VTGESRKALPLSQDIERANIVHLQVADGDVVMFVVFIQTVASGRERRGRKGTRNTAKTRISQ